MIKNELTSTWFSYYTVFTWIIMIIILRLQLLLIFEFYLRIDLLQSLIESI